MVQKRRTAASLALVLLIGSCGTGETQPERRRDVLFGYYGDCATCADEVKDHASMIWIAGWQSEHGHIETIIQRAADAAPKQTAIMLPGMYKNGRVHEPAFDAARAIFDGMRAKGVLGNVVAVYPQDEPDLLGLSDEAVIATNSRLRALMGNYEELASIPLAVIYSGSGRTPGISSYDWIGVDDYRLGERVLGGTYRRLSRKLRPDQRLLLVPGGASPWKQSPKPFFDYADRHPQVVGIVAFLWADDANPNLGAGIRTNGMADEYRRLSRRGA